MNKPVGDAGGNASASGAWDLNNLLDFAKRGDIGLALGVIAILVVLIMPMPEAPI